MNEYLLVCTYEYIRKLVCCRCVENMIRQAQLESKGTRQKVLSYIGMVFRHNLQAPDWYLDTAVATFLIRCVLLPGADWLFKPALAK